jgi:hypothetical protein
VISLEAPRAVTKEFQETSITHFNWASESRWNFMKKSENKKFQNCQP